MYVRLLRVKARSGRADEVRRFYEERALPALEETDGCQFAALLRQSIHPDDYLSMTIWDSAEAAAAWSAGGVYSGLLHQSADLLLETAEWKVKLETDPETTAEIGAREPPADSYRIEAVDDDGLLASDEVPRLYVRMVASRVARGKVDEFKLRYTEQIIPALQRVPGCRDVFLVEGLDVKDRFLSLTFWDREEDAVRYELSGEYDRLVKKLSDTLSEVYQWKLSLGAGGPAEIGGDALDREGYHLVSGRKLEP